MRRESINPAAEHVVRGHLSSTRKDISDIVGKEMLLYRCAQGRDSEQIMSMDLPFVIFIPYGKGNDELARRIPPASLQLDKHTAETSYEIVVTIQHGRGAQQKHAFPVILARYDTLSTFGMYNRAETAEKVSDHIVTLGISLPRWSYGPGDPVVIYVRLTPNPDWLNKARKVTVQKLTVTIDEEVIYNHEGDEPQRKTKTLVKQDTKIGLKLPEAGYFTNLGLVFPARDQRDSEGILPRGRSEFPSYALNGFTTTATLYKIEYFLTVKAQLSSAKDIVIKQPIVVCPLDYDSCKAEMDAIEQAAKDAARISPDAPMLPAAVIFKHNDPDALSVLGVSIVGGQRKPLIE